ncbi:MAG TPA: GntR family transcriptional regulator [Amycolatopsis sp.]|nr:GntR family transcriptional regulator [Amycolatopsis sp.]
MTPRSTVVRVPKAGEMVAAQLRRQIVTGELREGDALPSEGALTAQFGVSRPTLREAFRILESERVIEIRRGARGGAFVLVPDARVAGRYAGSLLQYRGTSLADVHKARAALESAAVGTLAKTRSAADLRRLDQALAEGEALLGDPVAFGGTHALRFHRLLTELAGNLTMLVLVDIVFAIIERHHQSFISEHGEDPDAVSTAKATHKAHVKVVGLIRARDADTATAFWRRHLATVSEYLISEPGETVLDVLS